MRNSFLHLLLLSSLTLPFYSCDEEEESNEEVVALPDGSSSTPPSGSTVPQEDDLRVFMFGNSLMVHEVTPEPTEEKKVPHWLGLLTDAANVEFAVDGRYGFMRQFADFSEISPQWGFETAPSVWTDEATPFAEIDYNRVIYTPTNFVQERGARLSTEPYYDDANDSPLATTISTFNQTLEAHPEIPIYIYEGWADMAGYGDFPSGVNLTEYYNDGEGAYHNWFIDYQDRLMNELPEATIKLIPVNLLLSKLRKDLLSDIAIEDFYEDDAPHGEPTLYFLAALITYSALYQAEAPDYEIPATVHASVRDNYDTIREFIWTELQLLNHDDGTSRVF